MAKKVKEVIGYSGGKENQMSGLGIFFLIVGIIGLIACFVVSGSVTKTSSYSGWGDDGLSPIWIAVGIVSLIEGIALFIVLTAGAEAIRLLKKLNGLTFGGEISEPTPEIGLKCSECGDSVSEYDEECNECGNKFEFIPKQIRFPINLSLKRGQGVE